LNDTDSEKEKQSDSEDSQSHDLVTIHDSENYFNPPLESSNTSCFTENQERNKFNISFHDIRMNTSVTSAYINDEMETLNKVRPEMYKSQFSI